MAFNDGDSSRWKRECESLNYMNHQLRRELEDTRQALQDATKDAQAAREESAELKRKVETFWDSIEEARASFVRSFPNYTYRDSHKRSREADERDRQSRKSQRTEHPASASGSGPPIAPGPPRDARRSRHDYAEGYPAHDSQFRVPRGQPHLTVPGIRSVRRTPPQWTQPIRHTPARPFPDPARPHVDGPRGPSISPTSRPAFRLTKATAMPLATPTHTPTPNHRHTRAMLVVNPPTQSRSRASAGQPMPSQSPAPPRHPQQLPSRPQRRTPTGRPCRPRAIIIHPPAAFQVSFADLQPGIFLDRADFGAEYPPNLDPPQGLQAVRCLFCDKHYSGANARSLWRRHVMGKHDFIMKGQRASTVRNRHLPQPGSLSTNGESAEPAPPSSVPSASPVVQASSRSFENRLPASQRAASPGRNQPNRASGDSKARMIKNHLTISAIAETRSPLTHAALENWNKAEVARGAMLLDGKVRDRFLENHRARTRPHPAGAEMEGKTVLQKAARTSSVNGVFAGAQIPGYHARCVGMDVNQVQAQDEWLCEDCNRKTAQRRQEAHRDGPAQEKDRTPAPRPSTETPPLASKEPQAEQNKREQDEDVDMQSAERESRPVEADGASGSDTEPVRSGASSVPRKINVRRVLSESQSPKPAGEAATDGQSEPSSVRAPPAPLPDEARGSEPPEQNRSVGSPARKKGWKGYALIPVPDGDEGSTRSGHTAEVVTTPGGTRRTRSGKAYIADDGVSASGSERQQSMETN
ncbi:ADP-ribose diphosphatase [Ceratobasidium sp. AG-Ba]|nr:ADP-ribose diphosphatase [Ceratobasidium sp. AG-Ba]